jgi:hypothetical protein
MKNIHIENLKEKSKTFILFTEYANKGSAKINKKRSRTFEDYCASFNIPIITRSSF